MRRHTADGIAGICLCAQAMRARRTIRPRHSFPRLDDGGDLTSRGERNDSAVFSRRASLSVAFVVESDRYFVARQAGSRNRKLKHVLFAYRILRIFHAYGHLECMPAT